MKAKDLAKILGVSPATVSLVLNNKAGVSESMRKRVLTGIQNLGLELPTQPIGKNLLLIIYRRHGIEQNATPYFNPIYLELIESIAEQSKRRGCLLTVFHMDEDNFENQYQQAMKVSAEGVMILATEMTKEQLDTLNFSIPVVLIDNYIPGCKKDCITIDNIEGVRLAVEHLKSKGHHRIGYVHVDHNANNFRERKEGFSMAMEDVGLPVENEHLYTISTEHGGAQAKQLLSQEIRVAKSFPTAFFADNDILATYLIDSLRDLGFKVPEDISVIGFDNMNFASLITPALTSIDMPKVLMGIIAVDTLCESILYINTIYLGMRRIQIMPRLIERKSVKELT